MKINRDIVKNTKGLDARKVVVDKSIANLEHYIPNVPKPSIRYLGQRRFRFAINRGYEFWQHAAYLAKDPIAEKIAHMHEKIQSLEYSEASFRDMLSNSEDRLLLFEGKKQIAKCDMEKLHINRLKGNLAQVMEVIKSANTELKSLEAEVIAA